MTVSDGELETTATFTLTINQVIDARRVVVFAGTTAEDTDFVLELSATDIDGDALTFLASVASNGSASVDIGRVSCREGV